jgi:hypothetical protein
MIINKEFFDTLEQSRIDSVLEVTGSGQDVHLAGVRRVRAQENVAESINEYRRFLDFAVSAIILKGEKQEEFAKKAEIEGGTITVDVNKAYNELFQGIWETISNTGNLNLDMIVAMHNRLERLAKTYRTEIFRMPMFGLTARAHFTTKESFVESLRADLLKEGCGFIVIFAIKQQILEAGLKAKASTNPVPVVICNAIDLERETLGRTFKKRNVEADASEDVVEVFKQLLNQLKTKE